MWYIGGHESLMPFAGKARRLHLVRLMACAPLLAQLAVRPNPEPQDSASQVSSGPRPNRVGIVPYANVQPPNVLSEPKPPREAACVIRDFGVGLLAAAGAVLLVTVALGPLTGFGEGGRQRAPRRAC